MIDREMLVESVALTHQAWLETIEPRYIKVVTFDLCLLLAKTKSNDELARWLANLKAMIDGRLSPYYPLKDKEKER